MEKSVILNTYHNLLNRYNCEVNDSDYQKFEEKKTLLTLLSDVENSSMAVFDMHKKSYSFIRTKFNRFLQYELDEDHLFSPEFFVRLMPVEDLHFTVDTMQKTFAFIDRLPISEKKDYKLIFEFRLADVAGNLYRFIQQCIVLELDTKGNMWMVLILNDLLPQNHPETQLNRKVIHIPSSRICLFKNNQEKSSNKILSKREMEILGLLSQGLQSKEISNRLFISVNTVNNHRQRIIEKMHVENTHEALLFARQIGII